jgi:D-glycero-D-manno-heptose 1,7-bisphosphate phosphatase
VAVRRRTARAVFLDKDGTLVENVPYNVDPVQIRLVPGAARALRKLSAAGYRIVVVSNQSGVARGLFDVSSLSDVERKLRELLSREGVSLDGFYFCPHLPDGSVAEYAIVCDCRKPAPGMLLRAADDLGVDLRRSWMIGDILDDVEAGRAAGCRTILVRAGSETAVGSPTPQTDRVARDLASAAEAILMASEVPAVEQDREPAQAEPPT